MCGKEFNKAFELYDQVKVYSYLKLDSLEEFGKCSLREKTLKCV